MTIERAKRVARSAQADAQNEQLQQAVNKYDTAIGAFKQLIEDGNLSTALLVCKKFLMICYLQKITCQINMDNNQDALVSLQTMVTDNIFSYCDDSGVSRETFDSLKYEALFRLAQTKDAPQEAIALLGQIPEAEQKDDVKYELARNYFKQEEFNEAKTLLVSLLAGNDLGNIEKLYMFEMYSRCDVNDSGYLTSAWQVINNLPVEENVSDELLQSLGAEIIIAKLNNVVDINASVQNILDKSRITDVQYLADLILQDYDSEQPLNYTNKTVIEYVLSLCADEQLKSVGQESILNILGDRTKCANDEAHQKYMNCVGNDSLDNVDFIGELNIGMFNFDNQE